MWFMTYVAVVEITQMTEDIEVTVSTTIIQPMKTTWWLARCHK